MRVRKLYFFALNSEPSDNPLNCAQAEDWMFVSVYERSISTANHRHAEGPLLADYVDKVAEPSGVAPTEHSTRCAGLFSAARRWGVGG